MFNLDQNTSEEGKIMATLTKADHASQDIILAALLRRLIDLLHVKLLWYSDQSLENTCPEWILHPCEVHSVNFWE